MGMRYIQQSRIIELIVMITLLMIEPTLVIAQEHSSQKEPNANARLQLAQAEQRFDFNLPRKPLAEAIADFANTTGLHVLYAEQPPLEVRSQPVVGAYTATDALQRLLAGTGFTARVTSVNTVTVARAGGQEIPSGRVEMETTTVLGSRRADVPLSNVPSAITVLDREDIHKEQSTTNRVDEIISRQVPGFNPTNNGVRQIRGRTAQVFVNGVPTNEALRASSGSDLNLVGADQLAGIEVARGANSAYGFGSPGGIIALSTPRAESEELALRARLRHQLQPSASWRQLSPEPVPERVADREGI